MLNVSLILLAAGNSTRLKIPCKKQNLYINDTPLWLYVAKQYEKLYNFQNIIIVCDDIKYYEKFNPNYKYIKGGKERFNSVKNAINDIDTDYVLITDTARAYINKKVLDELFKNIDDFDCVFPVINVNDTVFNSSKFSYENRNELKLVQTPQLSKTKILKNINLENYTDESSAIAAHGGKIKYILGDELSFKITTQNDLLKLKLLGLQPPSNKTFVGFGYDVHEFCNSNIGHNLNDDNKNENLILGGVNLGEKYALKAHSDGDVLCHALTDALLGACGLDDIGANYSPNDEKYHNANSLNLLQDAYKKCMNCGFELINADITICAEMPKILPHKNEILKNLIKALNCRSINIKATTTEKLGFIGRCEGVSVSAIVNMKYFDWSSYEYINN
ncbi:2-C-methyl-D-erythritol 2,4-cyclodiphosphate synthase [Campylobacter sp. MG1]|uniref:2-C-methyl-D-erythritol 2,4-cyclodiphosphate synthase n=1 Tax=Campylobacter sp. MG1 TaxID=2976332 RepID=UPI00226CFBCC|nr:2-C-methyl-D-erythritol 2,4-cyclodiphosphate synthase [Campylobacter sp. MG1]